MLINFFDEKLLILFLPNALCKQSPTSALMTNIPNRIIFGAQFHKAHYLSKMLPLLPDNFNRNRRERSLGGQ
jgi:hypothetical protein